MKRSVPFYANTSDDTHCAQAALKMLMAYYFPQKRYTFSQLNTYTGHRKGMYTYFYRAYLWLVEQGFEVVHIENFSVRKFATEGEGFLKRVWSRSAYAFQKKYSDFSQAQRDAQEAVSSEHITFAKRKGTIQMALKLFREGYFVIIKVNPYILRGEKGEGAHVVVLVGVEKGRVIVHDPGLPPQKELVVPLKRIKESMYGNNSLVIAAKRRK